MPTHRIGTEATWLETHSYITTDWEPAEWESLRSELAVEVLMGAGVIPIHGVLK